MSILSRAEPAADVVPLLQARLEAETHDAEQAQRHYDEQALAAADGQVDQKAADKAHDAFVTATQRRDRTARTLQAAIDRQAQQDAEGKHAALRRQLSQCQRLADKRADCADAVQAAAAAFAQAVVAQREATAELHAALPPGFIGDSLDGLWLHEGNLQAQLKCEFERLRLWHPIEPLHRSPHFAEKYRQAAGLFKARAAAFLEGAK